MHNTRQNSQQQDESAAPESVIVRAPESETDEILAKLLACDQNTETGLSQGTALLRKLQELVTEMSTAAIVRDGATILDVQNAARVALAAFPHKVINVAIDPTASYLITVCYDDAKDKYDVYARDLAEIGEQPGARICRLNSYSAHLDEGHKADITFADDGLTLAICTAYTERVLKVHRDAGSGGISFSKLDVDPNLAIMSTRLVPNADGSQIINIGRLETTKNRGKLVLSWESLNEKGSGYNIMASADHHGGGDIVSALFSEDGKQVFLSGSELLEKPRSFGRWLKNLFSTVRESNVEYRGTVQALTSDGTLRRLCVLPGREPLQLLGAENGRLIGIGADGIVEVPCDKPGPAKMLVAGNFHSGNICWSQGAVLLSSFEQPDGVSPAPGTSPPPCRQTISLMKRGPEGFAAPVVISQASVAGGEAYRMALDKSGRHVALHATSGKENLVGVYKLI